MTRDAAARALPPLVLVHGAWQGSWVWARLLPELEALGIAATAVELPGNGAGPGAHAHASLDAYAQHVLAVIDSIGEPVVVVGHSGGGITASQVAQEAPAGVAALVFLAGMMLPDGVAWAQLVAGAREGMLAPAPASTDEAPGYAVSGDDVPGGEVSEGKESLLPPGGIVPHLLWSQDRRLSTVPAHAARAVFLHDADEATAVWAAARLTRQPESGRAMAPRLTAQRYGRVPRLYIEATHDRSVPLAMQRMMQALSPGALTRALACGHVPQLVRPRETAQVLREGLNELLGLSA